MVQAGHPRYTGAREERPWVAHILLHDRRPPDRRQGISERILEQIVDVHVPRAVEQVTEVPKTSSRDRTLQCTAEQIFDVLVPEMAKQLMEVPETVSQDRIQQGTVEQIVDAPVPQAVEELAEIFRVSPRTGFNSVLWSRPLRLLHLLRCSLRCLSSRRKEGRNWV